MQDPILDNLNESTEQELKQLLVQLEQRELYYGIMDFDFTRIPQQNQLVDDFKNRLEVPIIDRVRYLLYYGGNGGGKSAIGCYVTVCLALGYDTKKYNLPFLGKKKEIWVMTYSGANVKGVIEPYLIGDRSIARIPPDEVENVNRDNGILKSITMKNGTVIHIRTYEQGREAAQGGNPDFIWLDEEPTKEDVVTEILARTRTADCELLCTMTPLSGITRIHDFFMKQGEELASKSRVYKVSSLDNPFTDKTWTLGLTPEEYKLRVEGSFAPPTGLVYGRFDPNVNIIPYIDPRELGEGRYYAGLDFGVTHPLAFTSVFVDKNNTHYVFDEYVGSNVLLKDLADAIKERKRKFDYEYIVSDTAAKREATELKAMYGIDTRKADKWSKGENDVSNRKAGIMYINELFYNGKLVIADSCKNLIRELQTHSYKDSSRDGEVVKENDDSIDSLRYILWAIKKEKPKSSSLELAYRKKFKETSSGLKLKGTTRVLNYA